MYAKQKHQVRQTKHQVRQTKHQVRQPKYQVRQTKHQVRDFNQKSTPKKTNTDIRCFVAMLFLSQIYALFGVPFTGLKNLVAYQK